MVFEQRFEMEILFTERNEFLPILQKALNDDFLNVDSFF